MPSTTDYQPIDFSNTEIAFESKSDAALRKMAWLFRMMNKTWLVDLGSKLGLWAIRWRLPLAASAVRATIFEQFCGGVTLLDSQKSIDQLWQYRTATVLDYGAEAKSTEQEFNKTMNENIRAIEFAARQAAVPVVSTKITGLARFELLEKMQKGDKLNDAEKTEYRHVLKRLDSICHVATENGMSIFFDAEESWIQDSIDYLVRMMMKRYNQQRAVVYNTFQMYRHDRLAFLRESYEMARQEGYLLGAKLVRGAYMDKERQRAAAQGYPSPIQPDKAATDRDYNEALRFCLQHYEHIALCNASHNEDSNRLMAEYIAQAKLPPQHPHLNFCQLYGMSDHLTFNLAKAGYNVAKYLPYGQVHDVIPYLIRRAQENSSVTGDMSRELRLIEKEISRRGL